MRALFFGSGAVAARGGRVPRRFAGSSPALTGGALPRFPRPGGRSPCPGKPLVWGIPCQGATRTARSQRLSE